MLLLKKQYQVVKEKNILVKVNMQGQNKQV